MGGVDRINQGGLWRQTQLAKNDVPYMIIKSVSYRGFYYLVKPFFDIKYKE